MKKSSRTKSTRLAKKLKHIREALELSQNQLLEQLGFADELFRSNISQYERGERVPAPPILLSYARLAKVDLEVLIDDDLDIPDETSTKRRQRIALLTAIRPADPGVMKAPLEFRIL